MTTPGLNECRVSVQWARALVLLALLGVLVAGLPLPSGVGREAQETKVAEARARKHLEIIAREPHSSGTEEARVVREYIRESLRALDVEVEFQSGIAGSHDLVNVLAKIPGRGDGGVVLFACHYDSVERNDGSHGPGAGDDGAAVASLLECARAIRASEPLRNDIWLLFTDGEELGLLGAKVFCQQLELVDSVDVVFNFEGIGNNGPSVMFQTSAGNSNLIREFAQTDCAKIAPSFAQAIYERMPNDTDFTVFSKHGMIGLNFAIVGGRSAYHRPWDTTGNLTGGTLQYQLDTVHGLADHFGELDLAELDSESDRMYFDLLGRTLFHMPASWDLGVFGLGILALIRFAICAKRQGARFSAAIGRTLAVVPIVGLFVFGLAFELPTIGAWLADVMGFEANPRGDALSAHVITWGAVCVGFAMLANWLRKVRSADGAESRKLIEIALGGGVLWFVLACASRYWLPLGSYCATIPLLLSSLFAPGYAVRVSRGDKSVLGLLGTLGVLALLVPSLGLITSLMSKPPLVAAILCGLAAGLAAPLCLPLIYWARVSSRLVVAFLWLFSFGLLLGGGALRFAGL